MGAVRPITQTEKQAMRSAYEQAYGSLDESVEPSDDYVSSKTKEVESGEIVASSLTEVTSKRNAKTMGIQTTVDTTGHVRLIKQKSKGEMPQNTEQLRTTLRIEGNMWCFMASKYMNKVFFRDMSPEIWLDYANYILGDKCYLMQVPTPGKGGKGKSDLAALRPPWIVILNYEYEMRREAVKRASRESRPLRETLTEVMKDFQLKEQYFTAPIALSLGQRDAWQKRPNLWGQEDFNKWQRNDWQSPKKGKDRKGKKGDKGDKGNKGGGKGDAKSGKGTTGRIPDGRLICYAYSNEGCDGNCGMVHCCQVRGCYGPHPTWKHWQDHFAKNDANKQKTDD